MGCESSKTSKSDDIANQRRNTVYVKQKAAIQVDAGVKLANEKGTILIFIFGKFEIVAYILITTLPEKRQKKWGKICLKLAELNF